MEDKSGDERKNESQGHYNRQHKREIPILEPLLND